jgi:hypothetical protein
MKLDQDKVNINAITLFHYVMNSHSMPTIVKDSDGQA